MKEMKDVWGPLSEAEIEELYPYEIATRDDYPIPERTYRSEPAAIAPAYLVSDFLPVLRIPDRADFSMTANQSKRARRDQLRKAISVKLCPKVALDVACEDTRCKREHDLEKYIAERGELSGLICPYYHTYGGCRYGHSCCFAVSHENDALLNVYNEEKMTLFGITREKLSGGYHNHLLPVDARRLLNRGKYDFAEVNRLVGQVKEIVQREIGEERRERIAGFVEAKARSEERRAFQEKYFKNTVILAPLTTVGNLPFRRLCVAQGVDVTVGEMAMSNHLVEGKMGEWALTTRHSSERKFGVQLAGSRLEDMAKAAHLIGKYSAADFIDINAGCPLDAVVNKGAGSALIDNAGKAEALVIAMGEASGMPITFKLRTACKASNPHAHIELIPRVSEAGAAAITLHGRSRSQRYTGLADWQLIGKAHERLSGRSMLVGNGDIYLAEHHTGDSVKQLPCDAVMVGRAALYKPWVFRELARGEAIDVSAVERFEMIRDFVRFGLDHWGADRIGVERTREFLLQWLSFSHRYIPVGLLERPAYMHHGPPAYIGRSTLETLLGSPIVSDWIAISEMLLGPVPDGFSFVPKHKSNAYLM